MPLDSQAQAIMLLTVVFGKTAKTATKPLSTREWGKFANWLKRHDLQPSSLLNGSLETLLADWKGVDCDITLPRLDHLLGRGGALGLAFEKWQRAGLWVLTRSDSEYPVRLKQRLAEQSPPVLFGCGNKQLLDKGGIAVVGSRNAISDDLEFTKKLGAKAAAEGYSIVSGGARGVDQNAMLGALEREGNVVGVLADSLLRSATSATYRKYLRRNDLVLVSPFNPEAGFNVGTAMARNRYIYCLADKAVVISSGLNEGGTWNGATEAIKARWVPVWVRTSNAGDSGNPELIRLGAQPWAPDDAGMSPLFDGQANAAVALPSGAPLLPQPSHSVAANAPTMPVDDFYELFLSRLGALTSSKALTTDEISKRLNLVKTQVGDWLKRGMREDRIQKLNRPVRYRYERQQSMHISAG